MAPSSKSYYDILGVDESASEADIKKAFRKLAREHHPDAGGDEETFKEINEAYETLSDASKRKEYDEMRKYGFGGGFGGYSGSGSPFSGGSWSVEDIFGSGSPFGGGSYTYSGTSASSLEDLFSQLNLEGFEEFYGTPGSSTRSSRARGQSQPKATKGSDLQVTLQVSFEEAFSGTTKKVTVKVPKSDSKETLDVKVPAGAVDGARLRYKGKGSFGSNGGERGDLLVSIKIKPHELYGRDGADVTLDLPLSIAEAALGTEVIVPAPDGSLVKIKIPAGTPDGKVFVIKGKGAPDPAGKKDGSLKVKTSIQVPEKLSASQRAALEALAAEDDPSLVRPLIASKTAKVTANAGKTAGKAADKAAAADKTAGKAADAGEGE